MRLWIQEKLLLVLNVVLILLTNWLKLLIRLPMLVTKSLRAGSLSVLRRQLLTPQGEKLLVILKLSRIEGDYLDGIKLCYSIMCPTSQQSKNYLTVTDLGFYLSTKEPRSVRISDRTTKHTVPSISLTGIVKGQNCMTPQSFV